LSAAEDYSGKVVAVTGAARGIGRNIAARFAAAGAQVYLCDVDADLGRKAADALRAKKLKAEFVAADLSTASGATSMISGIASKAGRLDVLVNNARAGKAAALLDETEASWDLGMSVTLKGAFFASQQAVRVMSSHGGGAILNIGSVAAHLATHESPAYHAAKAGLVQLTRYLAAAAGAAGVRANCICPGFIVQDEHRARYDGAPNAAYRAAAEAMHPLRKVGSSDDVAELALFLCSDRARFVSGEVVVLDGGATIQEQFSLLRRIETGRAAPTKK
jgi:NAD(P)-dependent dehydrogenase (short-subunit alcohol dehydrogenase family)